MERWLCIHGHFYQPPRENPWLEAVEIQDEARPYHDWNSRITAECYAPNAASRILDGRERILHIVNNYESMSFNFGPTLLSWMEARSPWVYRSILEADRQSRDRFSGHGSAMAQAYNHMIMPLADSRDKETQVIWGIRDFEHRFERPPEGMWLPETAVDLETLDIMAARGIRFTILAPRQALRVRSLDGGDWTDVSGERIDTRMAYEVRLPSGRTMAVFFYNGVVSKAVAFEKLLSSGEALADRLLSGFTEGPPEAQLVHIATDGESYGHHHRFGDMALAYAFHVIETRGLARLTNYGEFLEYHPPVNEVTIQENTSWSCVHGVDRWKADCGCHTGGYPGWTQAWRTPLREALDGLRDRMAGVFEMEGGRHLKDPRAARNGYVGVVLDRSDAVRREFFHRHAAAPVDEDVERRLLRLLESQRHAMLMFTSCGWFFDDIGGIETVQILQYAARALELVRDLTEDDLEPRFLETLAGAWSNRKEVGNGRDIYLRSVNRSMMDFCKVAAHHATCRLLGEGDDHKRFYCYRSEEEEVEVREAGRASLLVGQARFLSEITRDTRELRFGVLHFGDHNLTCGVGEMETEEAFASLKEYLFEVFDKADYHGTLRRMDERFNLGVCGLNSLFRDAQRRALDHILKSTLKDIEGAYQRLYHTHAPLMRFLGDVGAPPPRALHLAAEFVLHLELQRRFENGDVEPERIASLLQEARGVGVRFDTEPLEFSFRKSLERTAAKLQEDPMNIEMLKRVISILGLLDVLPFAVNLRTVQNICYDLRETRYPGMKARAEQGDEMARAWIDAFVDMSGKLWVRIDDSPGQ